MTGPAEPAESSDGYSAAYRVRFDEAGPDGSVRTSGLLRYTQDLAARHSEALGYDRAWYAERGLTWLVRTAEVEIRAAATHGSVLVGTTRVVGFRRVWSRRETTFVLPDGTIAAVVRIDWVLLDDRGTPTRIPAELERVFATAETGLRLGRVEPGEPPPSASRRAFRVRPQELDPMDHVNNAAYADWLDEAILAAARADPEPAADRRPVASVPRRVALEYARAAEPDESLADACWRGPDGWSWVVTTAGGTTELARGTLIESPAFAPSTSGSRISRATSRRPAPGTRWSL